MPDLNRSQVATVVAAVAWASPRVGASVVRDGNAHEQKHLAGPRASGSFRCWCTVALGLGLISGAIAGGRRAQPWRSLQRRWKQRGEVVRANGAEASSCGGAGAEPSSPSRTGWATSGAALGVGLYVTNVAANIFNKQVLLEFSNPVLNTLLYFWVGSLLSVGAWMTGLQRPPSAIGGQTLRSVFPLVVLHCSAILFTSIAVAKVNLSLVHTIKAAEPFYSALLSALLLRSRPSAGALAALALLVGGVILASVSEVSFNWVGFCAAMASNLGFCLKNVWNKALQHNIDELNLVSLLTIGSFLLGLPFALWWEAPAIKELYAASSVGWPLSPSVFAKALLSGACFHLYQVVSLLILYRASPVTHSVVNTLKRPVLILVSVVFFGTAMNLRNFTGVVCALAGGVLYSRAKR